MKLDTLVIVAHPDDAELSCAGTIISQTRQGKKVGIADLTRGELGTRGTPKIRLQEAEDAAKIMGLTVRVNLGMEDAFFVNDKAHQLKVMELIRKYRPEIIITNAVTDRHPDHGKGADLVKTAAFMSGLKMIETSDDQGKQEAWRPKSVYFAIQSQSLVPDFIVDVSDTWEQKMEAIRAFKSQFHNPNSQEPETYISSPEFLKMIESRGKELGHAIQVKYGEGFNVARQVGVKDLFDLI
ncbi:MAG: bacillithiol biosynthesis deacetylase BshB1 [Bacteroidota bacterium]